MKKITEYYKNASFLITQALSQNKSQKKGISEKEMKEDEAVFLDFIKTYSPQPPQTTMAFEDALMAKINTRQPVKNPHTINFRSPTFWAIPGAIAASLVLAFTAHQFFTPQELTPEEKEQLEAFIIDTWDGALVQTPSLTSQQNTSYSTYESNWLEMENLK